MEQHTIVPPRDAATVMTCKLIIMGRLATHMTLVSTRSINIMNTTAVVIVEVRMVQLAMPTPEMQLGILPVLLIMDIRHTTSLIVVAVLTICEINMLML